MLPGFQIINVPYIRIRTGLSSNSAVFVFRFEAAIPSAFLPEMPPASLIVLSAPYRKSMTAESKSFCSALTRSGESPNLPGRFRIATGNQEPSRSLCLAIEQRSDYRRRTVGSSIDSVHICTSPNQLIHDVNRSAKIRLESAEVRLRIQPLGCRRF
jgi:hypothetical protein